MKICFGYDKHLLLPIDEKTTEETSPGVDFVGMKFHEGKYKTVAHSSGDVISHAIADALSSNIVHKTIGELFPDNSPSTRLMSGVEILTQTLSLCNDYTKTYKKAYMENSSLTPRISIENVDITIITNEVKIIKVAERVRKNLSEILKISLDNIAIKGKTRVGCDISSLECYALLLLK